MFIRSSIIVLLIVTASLSASSQTLAREPKGKVSVLSVSSAAGPKVSLIEGNAVLVFEGDLISVAASDGEMYTIRLSGIDAPELKQKFGDRSRQRLAALLQGMDVKVLVHKKDGRGRYIGTVFLDGEDVSLAQLENGMAWYYASADHEQIGDDRKRFAAAEQKAKDEHLGLWDDKTPMSPWEYRGEILTPRPEPPATAVIGEQKAVVPASSTSHTPIPADTTAVPRSEVADPAKGEVVYPQAADPTVAAERKYILGPYGGCYYVSQSGRKVYVKDKTLCSK